MINPAGTCRLYKIASASMQRHDVASTLRRPCIDGVLEKCGKELSPGGT